ncbi:Selenocysteine insertion sequence-binding protein [Schistosoma japonicum]|nr:Selenocysteine insertion sequence-binding protein [Schistosoma japonicum]
MWDGKNFEQTMSTKTLHKYQRYPVKSFDSSGSLRNSVLSQSSSTSHSFPVKDYVQTTKPFPISKHSKTVDWPEAMACHCKDTISEALKENNDSSQLISLTTPIKRASHSNSINKCTTGISGNNKSRNISSRNIKTPKSLPKNTNILESPFVREIEEFIIPDNYKPEVTTSLRLMKAASEKHVKKIGRSLEKPKTKKLTPLKRCILDERAIRKAQRSHSLPALVKITSNITESTDITSTEKFFTLSSCDTSLTKPRVLSNIGENLVNELISRLVAFQDRAYTAHANSNFHRKRTKRLVCGFHEVIKHLKLKHMRVIFVARDLEGNATRCLWKNVSIGEVEAGTEVVFSALEKLLCQIWKLAGEYDPPVPIIITHSRKGLARLCHKPRVVSVVGVINADGAYEIEKELLNLKSGVNLKCTEGPENIENSMNKFTTGNSGVIIDEKLLYSMESIKIE